MRKLRSPKGKWLAPSHTTGPLAPPEGENASVISDSEPRWVFFPAGRTQPSRTTNSERMTRTQVPEYPRNGSNTPTGHRITWLTLGAKKSGKAGNGIAQLIGLVTNHDP